MTTANSKSVGRGKPVCKLIGENGNTLHLLGVVNRTLRKAGLPDQARELTEKVWGCGSYEEALTLFGEYVEIE